MSPRIRHVLAVASTLGLLLPTSAFAPPGEIPTPTPPAAAAGGWEGTKPQLLTLPNTTHLAIILDTSGSMRSPRDERLYPLVLQEIVLVLQGNPQITHLRIYDADGRYIVGARERWLPNDRENRQMVQRALLDYEICSNTSPIPGLIRALRHFEPPPAATARLALLVLGDVGESGRDDLERLERDNPRRANGSRVASIHAIVFPLDPEAARKARLASLAESMQPIATAHDGTVLVL